MKITRNTYPEHPQVAHGKPGDTVHWELSRGSFNLVRDADGKAIFATAPVDRDGMLRSNGQSPILRGIVAQVKSRSWILEIEEDAK